MPVTYGDSSLLLERVNVKISDPGSFGSFTVYRESRGVRDVA